MGVGKEGWRGGSASPPVLWGGGACGQSARSTTNGAACGDAVWHHWSRWWSWDARMAVGSTDETLLGDRRMPVPELRAARPGPRQACGFPGRASRALGLARGLAGAWRRGSGSDPGRTRHLRSRRSRDAEGGACCRVRPQAAVTATSSTIPGGRRSGRRRASARPTSSRTGRARWRRARHKTRGGWNWPSGSGTISRPPVRASAATATAGTR